MRKTTQKELKEYVRGGFAKDITHASDKEIRDIRKKENGLDKISYSSGVYGCNGYLVQGCKSGELYAITKRTAAIYSI